MLLTLRLPVRTAVAVLATIGLAACNTVPGDDSRPDQLVVFAAASLTNVFSDLGRTFEERHDAKVIFNFGGSSALAVQLNQGAGADVFAAADEASMRLAVDAGSVRSPSPFAANRLTIAVADGNPLGITGLSDLARDDVVVVLCAPEVPCGRLANAAFSAAGVEVDAASFEENVRAVASRIALGEADAGLVYETDVRARTRVADVPLGPAAPSTTYFIARTSDGDGDLPGRFIAFVRGAEGRAALRRAGFREP